MNFDLFNKYFENFTTEGLTADWFSGTASMLAVIVALGVYVAAEIQKKKARASIVWEACSSSAQVAAYYRSTRQLIKHLGSPASFEAASRIREHLITLNMMLDVLSTRQELSDGALFSAITAKRVGAQVSVLLHDLEQKDRHHWALVDDELAKLSVTVGALDERLAGVRAYFKLKKSTAEAAITEKYSKIAQNLDSGLVDPQSLHKTRY